MPATFDPDRFQELLDTRTLGHPTVYLASTASTQDVARRRAQGGAAEGLLVVADQQTAGRGRQGRRWVSPPGTNLYFTLVLRPRASELATIAMACPLAVVEGIEAITALKAGIKWPNDVLVNGKKIGGILVDSELEGERVHHALAGIGVNVNFDPRSQPEIAEIATSVMAASGQKASREELLAAILGRLEAYYLSSTANDVFDAWSQRLVHMGDDVTVHSSSGELVSGRAESVNADGSLVLLKRDGERVTLPSGQMAAAS
ncbi:MAG: biotin--[acetyl-CoA-carboxylase] ligase [Dehalococcoidia bacterium]